MTTRAAIYLRISQDRSGDGLAEDRQREDCRRIARERNWEIVGEWSDTLGASDRRKSRPGYDDMVSTYERGEIDAIIPWDLDRLTRQPRQLEDWIELAEDNDLAIVTANGEADLTTDNGRLFARIKVAVAKGEVERKVARQKRANLQRAEQGRPPMRRAFGYTAEGELDRPEAGAVRECFERFLSGGSITAITNWLNAEGYTTTTGRPWERTGVRKMLKNLRYAGISTYRGKETGAGQWPAIVPEETVRAAVDMLADPGRRRTQGTARRWLGARLYLCGRCPKQTVSVNYDKNGARQYRCEKCFRVRRADPIDELVKAVVVARLRRSDLRGALAETGPDLQPLRNEANGIRVRLEQLAGNLDIDELTLSRRTKALNERLDEIETQLSNAGRTSALERMLNAPDPGVAWLAAVEEDVVSAQAVVRELVTVTLLQGKPGRVPFDPATVRFD